MSIEEIISICEKALKCLAGFCQMDCESCQYNVDPADALSAWTEAIALLRTHPDNQPNKPLTLEELREMDGQPVYLALDKKWYIVSANYEPPRGEAQPCGIDLWGAGTSLRLLAECGMYRRPPKEE